jgi:hypothetical protein
MWILYFIVLLDQKKYLLKNNYMSFFQKGVVLSGFVLKYPWIFRDEF